jgi:hypothetical protein
MLSTLVLAAALNFGPAQSGLNLTNSRVTFGGQFGPNRPDHRYLPGDLFFMVFDIEGLRGDAQGRVNYAIGMVVTNSAGKEILNNKPEPTEAVIPLGASKLPARAFLIVPGVRGAYTCTMTVTDRKTNASKSVSENFEVIEPAFGIVGFRVTYDMEDTMPAPLQGVTGQALVMHFGIINFMRDPVTHQPTNQIEVRIFDESGKPTTEQPQLFVVKQGVNEDKPMIELNIPLTLSREGNFTVELKATDALANKSYKMAFKVKVMQPDVKG